MEGRGCKDVRDALRSQAARERRLLEPAVVDRLLADPNGELTHVRGNVLWQVNLLGLRLQHHGVG